MKPTGLVRIGAVALLAIVRADVTRAAEDPLPIWRVPLESLTEMRSRPPFTPTRQPAPRATVPGLAGPSVDSPPPLLGVIQSSAGMGIAVVQERGTDRVHRLRIGQDVGGWRLVGVHPGEAAFERAGRTEVIALRRTAPGAVAPAPEPIFTGTPKLSEQRVPELSEPPLTPAPLPVFR